MDSGDMLWAQSENRREENVLQSNKAPRPARPLAYYGILGLQSKVRKTGNKLAKNRPPSAPPRIGLCNSDSVENAQRPRHNRATAGSALLKRPRIPCGLSNQSDSRLKSDAGFDKRTAATSGTYPPRPLSANLQHQPASYFDALLESPASFSSSKVLFSAANRSL